MMRRSGVITVCLAAWLAIALGNRTGAVERALPRPDHVVVVVLENHSFSTIFEGGDAPFIRRLALRGAMLTNSFALRHPSEPNYFALFSGSTQNISDDGFYFFDRPTLAGALRRAGQSFIAYAEAGAPRKHRPWRSFRDSEDAERDLAEFPDDFSTLPTVSFVTPNPDHNMHDGSIGDADRWLREHLGAYIDWCKNHNSLLILTFDEDDDSEKNRILTVFFGGPVRPGRYDERITHYAVLRTILAMYGLAPLANSADVPPISDIWRIE